ncbi:MAG: DUF4430 domain-containing protein [Oscillospiraceae bacterium]|nr:DUF4430 domain-containing protein [Oscillospiraceae bacterium]
MKSTKKLTIILAVVIVAVVAGAMLYVYHRFAPQGEAGEKHITITIRYDDGAEKTHELDTEAQYLLEALESVAELNGEETAQGYTLYGIDGVEADFTTSSAYWAVYVNDGYGAYSLDKQPVSDGDQFVLAYETF